MIHDAFKAYKTDNVKVLLSTNNTNLELLSAGCTSKYQPLGILRNFWEDAKIVTHLTETAQQRQNFKLPSPSRQDIVNWIAEGINYFEINFTFVESQRMIRAK